jgi:hypothetical protein
VLALAAALVAGCGDDDEPASSSGTPSPTPTATASAAPLPSVSPSPTATETAEPTATATATPEPESPEDQPGGAGDEEEVRVPVRFTVGEGGIEPPQVAVPAFLALELIVVNDRAEPVVATLEGADPLAVGPGETGQVRLEGRRKGRYTVTFEPGGEAVLVTGAEPGP